MTGRRFRNVVFKVHTWLGIHVFLILALLSITGTLLIYSHQIDALLVSGKRVAATMTGEPRPSFGDLYEQARLYDPDAVITRIVRADSDWIADTGMIWTIENGQRLIWFGGDSWAVSHEAGPYDFYTVVRELHDSLLTRQHLVGIFVCTFSILLLVFLITGTITYRRFWRGFFRWPSRARGRRMFWSELHRLAAVWSLPFLVVVALTGGFYLLDRLVTLPYQSIEFERLSEREEHIPSSFDGKALDRAVSTAESATPGLEIKHAYIPGQPHEGLLLMGQSDVLLTDSESNRILIDPVSLAIVHQLPAADLNAAHRIAAVADRLHFGTFGDDLTEYLWTAFGILSTVLFFAGAMVYASRTDEPGGNSSAAARVLSASVLTKVGYSALFLAIIAVAVLRFGM